MDFIEQSFLSFSSGTEGQASSQLGLEAKPEGIKFTFKISDPVLKKERKKVYLVKRGILIGEIHSSFSRSTTARSKRNPAPHCSAPQWRNPIQHQ